LGRAPGLAPLQDEARAKAQDEERALTPIDILQHSFPCQPKTQTRIPEPTTQPQSIYVFVKPGVTGNDGWSS